MPNKIVVLGRAGVGKTSLLKVVFGGMNPEDLLKNPLSPTRAIETTVANWIDVELGLFDTSGQELGDFMKDPAEQKVLFEEASVALYVMDYDRWVSEKYEIAGEIRELYKMAKKYRGSIRFYIVFNKIDRIGYEIDGIFDLISKNINLRLAMPTKIKVLFTSIEGDLAFTAFKTFADLIILYSTKLNNLKNRIDILTRYRANTVCLLTNSANDKVMLESISDDFHTDSLFTISKRLSMLTRTDRIKGMNKKGTITVGSKEYKIHIEELAENPSNVKRMILLSESMDDSTFKDFQKNVKAKISS